MIVRLVRGCSWESVEHLLDGEVSDTTLRSRRDEWVSAGVFELIAAEAVAAWDPIMGLRLGDVCIDGSIHKAPCGGPAEPAQAPLGLRWTVERANSWLSNYGQLRRNTDRRTEHRLAQIDLAVALIITIKLINHPNRWQPADPPIR